MVEKLSSHIDITQDKEIEDLVKIEKLFLNRWRVTFGHVAAGEFLLISFHFFYYSLF